jgi:DNA-3-methyladenine glycosylase II
MTKEMKKVVKDLSARDSRLAKVISTRPLCTLGANSGKTSNFESLVESVVSQQLSVKAADTIYGRLLGATKDQMIPRKISKLSDTDMRQCGLSAAKTKTIKGLADADISGLVKFETLHEIADDELISSKLNSLWGIGPWTVDMFMMHQLGRLDVWPTGDFGVRRGWERMYGLNEKIEPKELHIEGEKFRPYRSVVAWYCWKALDG